MAVGSSFGAVDVLCNSAKGFMAEEGPGHCLVELWFIIKHRAVSQQLAHPRIIIRTPRSIPQ